MRPPREPRTIPMMSTVDRPVLEASGSGGEVGVGAKVGVVGRMVGLGEIVVGVLVV